MRGMNTIIGLTCMLLLASVSCGGPTQESHLQGVVEKHSAIVKDAFATASGQLPKIDWGNLWNTINTFASSVEKAELEQLSLAVKSIPECNNHVNTLNSLISGIKNYANGKLVPAVSSEVDKITAKILEACQSTASANSAIKNAVAAAVAQPKKLL